MKVDILDAHDRLEHLKKNQSDNMIEGLEECRLKNPNAISMQEHFPYIYIFCHPRTAEDGATKRMLWQPRLMKPRPQTNSYCFRLISKTDLVEIIWMLPPRELWSQYESGNLLENENISVSIDNFLHHRKELAQPHQDDWTEDKIREKLKWIESQNKWEKQGFVTL